MVRMGSGSNGSGGGQGVSLHPFYSDDTSLNPRDTNFSNFAKNKWKRGRESPIFSKKHDFETQKLI